MVKIGRKNIFKDRKSFPLYLLIILLMVWLIINGLFGAKNVNNTELKSLNIAPGSSTNSIANTLEEEGVISNAQIFKSYIIFNGFDGSFKAGNYKISPAMTINEIAMILSEGQTDTMSLTIPEGYTLTEIANLMEKKGLVDQEEFWDIVQNESFSQFEFLKDVPEAEKRLEGYLFPDTYKLAESMPAKDIISLMLKRFEDVYTSLPENKSDLSARELIILASVIEKEAVLEEERPVIASVFINRLNIDMRLQSCATLQYVLPERQEVIYTKDTKIDSPYNTYKNYGLPAGPICSPGKASLIAASQPAETDYIYFVAKKDASGGHLFSTTHEEHVQNKKKLGY